MVLVTKAYVCMLLLLFLTFSVLVANPKKLLYTVANPARGLLNREKRTKEKVWQHTPPPTPHTARSEKINKITRRIYRRYAGGRSRVRTRIPSARRLGLGCGFAILHSRLRYVCMYVCMYVCIFIKLHITAQSGLVILVILCHLR